MRRVAAIAALAIALLVPNAHAAGLDQTCELTATRFDADTVNALFPDSSAQYWTGSYRAIPGTHIRIDGIYPYARYTSWNVYDPILRPFTHMYDAQIAPNPGSTNPFLPGATRNTPVSQRHYTLYITFDKDFKPGPNTIYVDPQSNPVGFFTLRVYVPDRGRDVTGGVGIPQVTWQPNDQGAPAFTSPCTTTQKPTVSAVTPVYAQQNGPDNGAQMPGRNQPVWHKFKNLCWAGQDLFFDNPYGDNLPAQQSPCDNAGNGGFLSNMDNAYIYTGLSRGYGKAVVLHGKAPTFADTYKGAKTMPSGEQLRYWSICQNDPYNQRYIACLRDDQVKVDSEGFYTIVVSTPADKPSCVKHNWIPWGPQPWGTLIYRHMLPDPSFSESIQNASTDLGRTIAPPGSMGDYYPSARYLTDPSSFCAKKK